MLQITSFRALTSWLHIVTVNKWWLMNWCSDWTYMKMNFQVLWTVYGPGIDSRDSDAYMMLLTRSLFRNWSWKIPPEVKNVQQLHFSFNLSASSYPFNSVLFENTNVTKRWRGVSRTPLNVGNSLSMVYWLLRVIPLGRYCFLRLKNDIWGDRKSVV